MNKDVEERATSDHQPQLAFLKIWGQPAIANVIGSYLDRHQLFHKTLHDDSLFLLPIFYLLNNPNLKQSTRARMSGTDPRPQPSRSSSHHSSTSSYFSYPVSVAVSGIFRRLSTEPTNSSKSSRSSPSHSQTNLATGMNGAYFSPPRTASPAPFQPPPLTALNLQGWKSSTGERAKLLTRTLAEEIRLLFPARNQLVDRWRLIYSLDQDGSSLSTLYKKADDYRGKRGGFVLVVRDGDNNVSPSFSPRLTRD